MRKDDEVRYPNSYLNKALGGEPVFVLLARDRAAPVAIREWADRRILTKLNKENDPQIVSALAWADIMSKEQRHWELQANALKHETTDTPRKDS